MRKIKVGTRQSALAMTQSGQTLDALKRLAEEAGLPLEFEVVPIVTRGDRILDVTLSKVGGKGLFVKEIEEALLGGEIDIAIHSMKDMPFELPEGLVIGCVPPREDPRDALVNLTSSTLSDLPPGARIGTSSLRRSAQLQSRRPDFRIESLRGNIDTRLRKLESEGLDAIVLAAAGLKRMGWSDRITAYIEPGDCLPAVGQGALAIECRASDDEVLALLAMLNDTAAERAVAAERTFLGLLNGGCQVPIGAYATAASAESDAVVSMTGMVAAADGRLVLKASASGSDPAEVGRRVAEELLGKGADALLAEARE
ncbi:hydroxymethylbilane synthase [Cohnella sp. OV330]|uniref:hydroxymethylbilane synthase n=1 Tax=Cohnella sp. OV330 TaxID=1855288 RepID=UPI0008E90BE9|nr:hydroxymethylbilane synthase [Cohnella sp. OV330]SFB40165.1 hydroxymethylbilane synthase [Cohnella sp. OV330]